MLVLSTMPKAVVILPHCLESLPGHQRGAEHEVT